VRSLVFGLLLAGGAALAAAAFGFRSRVAQRLRIWRRDAAGVFILLVFAVGAYRLGQLGF